jgi:putative transposase
MREEFRDEVNWSKRFLPHYDVSEKYQLITYRLADNLPQNISLGAQQPFEGKSFNTDKELNYPGAPQPFAGKSFNTDKELNYPGAQQPFAGKSFNTDKELNSPGAQQPFAGKSFNTDKELNYPGAPQPFAGKSFNSEVQRRKYIEEALDKGHGSCLLRDTDTARCVLDNWLFYDKKMYDLFAYVIMPNHVHILIKTREGYTLGKIIWAWKSFVTRYVKNNEELRNRFLYHYEKIPKSLLKSRAPENKQRHIKPAKGCGAPDNFSIWQREYWDRFIRDEKHFNNAIEYIHDNPVKAGLVKSPKDWQWSSYNNKESIDLYD